MITVGLIKELYFVSEVLKTQVESSIRSTLNPVPILIKIHNNVLEVEYFGFPIWKESIDGDTAFFGVESCDSISRIIACINNGDIKGAERLYFDENKINSLDKIPKPV
jgi:hypothetical protein